ncbi:hypothetical protein AeNC1_019014, partial [Aphanomyces euteiches]
MDMACASLRANSSVNTLSVWFSVALAKGWPSWSIVPSPSPKRVRHAVDQQDVLQDQHGSKARFDAHRAHLCRPCLGAGGDNHHAITVGQVGSRDASPVMCVDAPLSTMMGLDAATDCRAVSSQSSILAVNVQTHSSRLCLSRSTSSFLVAFGLPVPIFAAPVAFALLAAFVPTMALFCAKRSFIVIAAAWWTQGAGLDGGLILGFQEGADACKVAAQ